jgi:HEAT repeat protein
MRLILMAGLAVLLSGCCERRPTLAGGKPVSHWVAALADADPAVRKKAAFKLGNVGPAALPALVGALKDEDPGVRREVILALLKCGPAAREAVPTLSDLRQRDLDPQVRTCADRALEKLQAER